jgi:hypothetical protein
MIFTLTRAVFSILLSLPSVMPGPGFIPSIEPTSDTTYLFDCSGRIQRIDGLAPSAEPVFQVSQLDSTLPVQVRDGCSIRAGHYDRVHRRLLLVVQPRSGEDSAGLSTRVLTLATPMLVPIAGERQNPGEAALMAEPVMRLMGTIRSPFPRSAAYLLSDTTTLLLQELVPSESAFLPVELASQWQSGKVSLRQPRADATGRYAVWDLATGALRGTIVTVPDSVGQHRVICFTPGGELYLAATRHVLLVFDTSTPTRPPLVREMSLDLYWTACG